MVKILIIFTYNVSLETWKTGGYLLREFSYYQKLVDKGIEIILLTYGNKNDLNYSKGFDNFKIIPCNNLIKSRIPGFKFLKSFLLPIKLKALFKDVDIIKTVQVNGSWVGWVAKLFFKKKLIVRGGYEWLRNFTDYHIIKGKKFTIRYLLNFAKILFLEFIAYKLADAIVLTSKTDIEYIIKKFNMNKRFISKIRHIYNFIDTELFKPINLPKKEKHILFIGILYKAKNLFNLFKAIKELGDFTLDIVGKGPLEQVLREKAIKEGINVNFLGIISNQELPNLINQYQIYILPSFYEGNPKVLLEAMSCGIACIGTNVRGINNIIINEINGYLCNPDYISIKNAILNLYNNKDLRKKIGWKARDFILNNCSLEFIIKKELNLYKSLF